MGCQGLAGCAVARECCGLRGVCVGKKALNLLCVVDPFSVVPFPAALPDRGGVSAAAWIAPLRCSLLFVFECVRFERGFVLLRLRCGVRREELFLAVFW